MRQNGFTKLERVQQASAAGDQNQFHCGWYPNHFNNQHLNS